MKPFTRAVLTVLLIEVLIAAVVPLFLNATFYLSIFGLSFFYLAILDFLLGVVFAIIPATRLLAQALLLCAGLTLLIGFFTCSMSAFL